MKNQPINSRCENIEKSIKNGVFDVQLFIDSPQYLREPGPIGIGDSPERAIESLIEMLVQSGVDVDDLPAADEIKVQGPDHRKSYIAEQFEKVAHGECMCGNCPKIYATC